MSAFNLSTSHGRFWTYLHYIWNDHAYFRLAFSNAHWISEELVRANQPWPFQVKAWKDRGIRTILNLRGEFDTDSHYVLEREACERYGVKLVTFTVYSREAPTAGQVVGAKALFETLEYPVMMHCKSGADRAGMMSALYMHFRQGLPIREAMDQLHLKFGHFRQGLVGVLDYTFDRYLEEGEPAGLSFLEWVQSPAYDPKAMKRQFKSTRLGTLITEKLLRRE
ncbi:MAG: protein tyrosine phosphatase [Caulobacterales bacterium]